MSWFSKGLQNVVDEASRTPRNIGKFGPAAVAAGVLGPLGPVLLNIVKHPPTFGGKKGGSRGPRPVGPNSDPEMPDLCRVVKGNGSVITDEEEVIYDYKAVTGAQTAAGVDIFDDTTTTNITEAKKLPEGLYKAVAITIEVNNAADTLGMCQDAIIRMKAGKNGDIVWERALADLSDFLLIDTAHGTFLRQDSMQGEDADIIVMNGNDLTYFNVLFPSIPTFTGTAKVNIRLRKFPLPANAK